MPTSAAHMKIRLAELEHEQALALDAGLLDDPGYAADLLHEIATTRAAYVGSAVVELASLRAALSGPLLG